LRSKWTAANSIPLPRGGGTAGGAPWGRRYEIVLSQVEFEGREHAVSGGLPIYIRRRAELRLRPKRCAPATACRHYSKRALHASTSIRGACDARTDLARQGVDVIGTIPTADSLQKLDSPPPNFRYRLGRWRRGVTAQDRCAVRGPAGTRSNLARDVARVLAAARFPDGYWQQQRQRRKALAWA
jgi:hypothetical protein